MKVGGQKVHSLNEGTVRARSLLLTLLLLFLSACQSVESPEVPRLPEPVEEAVEVEEQVPRKTNPAAEKLRQDAVTQLETGNPQVASSMLERALRIDPDSADAYFQLARVRVLEGFYDPARQLVLKALDLLDRQGITSGQILADLTNLLGQIGRLQQR